MRFLLALGFVILCACAPVKPPPPAEPPQVAANNGDAGERASCAAKGGNYTRVGLLGSWACVLPMPDAGKVCSDNADCAGQCIFDGQGAPGPDVTVHGLCQRTNSPFGCYSVVEHGHAQPPLCVD